MMILLLKTVVKLAYALEKLTGEKIITDEFRKEIKDQTASKLEDLIGNF